MMQPELISVIVPVLNDAQGLQCALDSLFAQKSCEIEIIVIDGGSSDGSLSVIERYSDRITYWESGKDTGIANAFNRGIAQATGSVVAILNSDDVWLEDTAKHVVEACHAEPDVDIYCGSVEYYDESRKYGYAREPNIDAMKRHMAVFHPALFVRRQCYETVGLFNEGYTHAMDSEWVHRAMSKKIRFSKVSYVLARMTLGGVSDYQFMQSLQQYRDSSIKHGLAYPMTAWYYYMSHVLRKCLMQLPFMHIVKRFRDRMMLK